MLHRHVLALLTFLAFAFAVVPSTQADTIQLLSRSQLTPGFATTDYPNVPLGTMSAPTTGVRFQNGLTVTTGSTNVTFTAALSGTAGPVSRGFVRRDQGDSSVGGIGFLGDFPDRTELLVTEASNGTGTGPLTINFSIPILEFGLDAQNAFAEFGQVSTFSFSLFQGATLLDTYSVSGPDGFGTFFLGARAILGQQITRITISGMSSINDPDIDPQNNFAIGPVSFTPVPEPTTMILLGTGLVGAAVARRRKRKESEIE